MDNYELESSNDAFGAILTKAILRLQSEVEEPEYLVFARKYNVLALLSAVDLFSRGQIESEVYFPCMHENENLAHLEIKSLFQYENSDGSQVTNADVVIDNRPMAVRVIAFADAPVVSIEIGEGIDVLFNVLLDDVGVHIDREALLPQLKNKYELITELVHLMQLRGIESSNFIVNTLIAYLLSEKERIHALAELNLRLPTDELINRGVIYIKNQQGGNILVIVHISNGIYEIHSRDEIIRVQLPVNRLATLQTARSVEDVVEFQLQGLQL